MRTTSTCSAATAATPGGAGTHPTGPAGRRPTARRRPGPVPGAGRDRRRSLQDLAEAFARVYLEVECGRRPASQASRILDPRLAAQLEGVWVRHGAPGRLLSLTGTRTAVDAYEAVAVVLRGSRVGAIAIRLAHRRGRWVVAQADRPEDGPLPEPPFAIPDDEWDPAQLDELDDLGDLGALGDPRTAAVDRMGEGSVGAERTARLA